MQPIGDPVTQLDYRGTTHDVVLLDPIVGRYQRRKLP